MVREPIRPNAKYVVVVPVYDTLPDDFEYMGDRVFDEIGKPDPMTHTEDFGRLDADVLYFETTSGKAVFPHSLRGKTLFIVHPYYRPHDTHAMTSARIANAAKLSEAEKVILVEPYNKAWRQDKVRRRESLDSRLVASFYCGAGINKVISFDPHCDQIAMAFPHERAIEGFHLSRKMARFIRNNGTISTNNLTVAAPDAGASKRAEVMASEFEVPLAIFIKTRDDNGEKKKSVLYTPHRGPDIITGRDGLLYDDVIVSGSSTVDAEELLKEAGMGDVAFCATHLDLTDRAYERLEGKTVIGTNSVPGKYENMDNYHVMPIEPILAEIIKRHAQGKSLSALFDG